jgi:hypothetical protein
MTPAQAMNQVVQDAGYESWGHMERHPDITIGEWNFYRDKAFELYCLEERRRTWDEACEAMHKVCADQISAIDVINKVRCIDAPKPEFKP